MKSNKGFTMIELLATIVILGFLATIGVVSTGKYLTQSKEKSYRIMSQSVYEAYENCAIQGNCILPSPGSSITYNDITQLKKIGYLDSLRNPNSSKSDCTGLIVISADSNQTVKEYVKYHYEVRLDCEGMQGIEYYTWPDDKTK